MPDLFYTILVNVVGFAFYGMLFLVVWLYTLRALSKLFQFLAITCDVLFMWTNLLTDTITSIFVKPKKKPTTSIGFIHSD